MAMSACKDIPKYSVRWRDTGEEGEERRGADEEERQKKNYLKPFFFFFHVSPKSLDWIGQEHGFRISAYDGFRI